MPARKSLLVLGIGRRAMVENNKREWLGSSSSGVDHSV